MQSFCSRFSLDSMQLRRWHKRSRDGVPIRGDNGGRPRLLDEEARKEFDSFVTLPLNGITEATISQTRKKFGELVEESSMRRGVVVDRDNVDFSGRSFYRSLVEAEVSSVAPQRKTLARIEAEADPRNFFTWAVLLFAFANGKCPEMMANWDFTTFGCLNEDGDNEKVYFKKLSAKEAADLEQKPITVASAGDLGLYIKKAHLHNAHGNIAPPMYFLQDDTMDDEDFTIHKVAGLSHSSDITAFGYVVFGKSRCMNLSFYKWFFTDHVFPFVVQCREASDAKVN